MESATDSMPSVTMNGGIFVRDTKIPLMSPATVAAARAPIVPPTMPKSERKKTIAEIDMATREPTARSNPPPMTTKAWPKDTRPKAAALAMTRIRFVGLMKTPCEMTVAMTRTATSRKSWL